MSTSASDRRPLTPTLPTPQQLQPPIRHVTGRFFEKLNLAEWIATNRRFDQLPTLGSGITAHTSVPTAMACYLLEQGSFADAITTAISLGGDTDTIASMTGALVGTHLGLTSIPPDWRGVELADHLTVLANQLASR